MKKSLLSIVAVATNISGTIDINNTTLAPYCLSVPAECCTPFAAVGIAAAAAVVAVAVGAACLPLLPKTQLAAGAGPCHRSPGQRNAHVHGPRVKRPFIKLNL